MTNITMKPGKKPTIVIVDDDDIDVRVIKRSLKKHKIDNDTLVAHDGIEALELLRNKPRGKPDDLVT